MGSILSFLHRAHLRPRYPFLTFSPAPADAAGGAARVAVGTLPADAASGRPAGLTASVWNQDAARPTRLALGAPGAPPLPADLDALIIGGGVAGLSVAYELAVARGKKVAVLEGRCIGAGQSLRTTAHLMAWHDDFYYALESEFGHDTAAAVAASQAAAIDWIEGACRAAQIDACYTPVTGYLVPADASHDAVLDKEAAACARLGVDARAVDLDGSPAVGGYTRALAFPGCADINPGPYLAGLAAAVERAGGVIYEGTRVHNCQRWSSTAPPAAVLLDGRQVSAPAIVLATNSPTHRDLLIHARQSPWRSYAVALDAPLGGGAAPLAAQFWTTEEQYHYVRRAPHPDGTPGRCALVVGGEDHPCGSPPPGPVGQQWARLEAWARARWTGVGAPLRAWSGIVLEPADKLSLAGADPGGGGIFVVTGDSGQGYTGAAIGAMVVGAAVAGSDEYAEWTKIFSPSRVPRHAADVPGLAEETAANVKGFSAAVLPSFTDIESLVRDAPAGTGAIVQAGPARKAAVYVGGHGGTRTVSSFSALCGHMSCCVSYNAAEQCFDCPCHSSCFDRNGVCVQGPATSDMKPVDLGAAAAVAATAAEE